MNKLHFAKNCMILSTLVTSQLHFEMCAGLYGHPVQCMVKGDFTFKEIYGNCKIFMR